MSNTATAADLRDSLGKAELKTISILEDIAEMSGNPAVPRRELVRMYPYGARVVGKLKEKGIIEILNSRVYRTPLGELLPHVSAPEVLTPEQLEAVSAVTDPVVQRKFATFLLHGVTGSGKTEVYLRAAETCLKEGRTVLVLVPEIALATQIEAHFVSRFKDIVALLHSGLSSGERYDEWSRIYTGAAKIVIGARSAVFAPLANLGLVIVDEEHDASFKQEDGLRYNGRDVSIVRAKQSDATVILGSATPSVSTYYHALSGKYKLLTMSQRVGDSELPRVSVIDLKGRVEKTDSSLFHRDLLTGLQKNLDDGKQAILLLNRRGFSTSLICDTCGAKLECRHCRVTLNYHKKINRYLCHYCGFSLAAFDRCSGCGSETIRPIGSGTEKVVEEVARLIPDARVERLDSDISADRKVFLTVLQAMGNGEIDILVGTQIIAKGLHFPNVTLVGIVFADGGLAFPDFRAAERTYQLIAQVTGRAGRGVARGSVIVQTLQPEHYAIGLAAEHRYETLAEREIEIRKHVGFPPFRRLAAVRIEDASENKARSLSGRVASEARSWCTAHDPAKAITILGPAPAPLERLRDQYRWQILLKSDRVEPMHALVEHLETHFKSTSRNRVIIDIDPENML
jgi:primosomal protein N' (replication factor Y)